MHPYFSLFHWHTCWMLMAKLVNAAHSSGCKLITLLKFTTALIDVSGCGVSAVKQLMVSAGHWFQWFAYFCYDCFRFHFLFVNYVNFTMAFAIPKRLRRSPKFTHRKKKKKHFGHNFQILCRYEFQVSIVQRQSRNPTKLKRCDSTK